MKIWVVMVDDRHRDPEPECFTAEPAAMEYARQVFADNLDPEMLDNDEIGEQETPRRVVVLRHVVT